jgi:myo-inositol-1(or 4)-monophosphatase
VPATIVPTAIDGRGAFEVAEQAVRASGAVIMAHLPQMTLPPDQRTVSVTNKAEWNNIVTDVDHAAERAILAILDPAFPNDAILAEESGARDGTSGFSWCIDPLDGTRNFASGIPHFAVNLALSQGNRILLGLTYDPVRDELFHAIEGGGAFLNGQPITVSKQAELTQSILSTDMSYKTEQGKLLLQMLAELWPGVQGIRMMDSAALGLAYVAAGRFEIYLNHHVQPWDIAPGILLIREAGGITTDIPGSPAHPASGAIIAAHSHVHTALMNATQAAPWRSPQP